MSDEFEADRPEEESEARQLFNRFVCAARTLGFAVLAHGTTDRIGNEVMNGFLEAFLNLETVCPSPADSLSHPDVETFPVEEIVQAMKLFDYEVADSSDFSNPPLGALYPTGLVEARVVTDMNGSSERYTGVVTDKNGSSERYTILPPPEGVE